MKRTPRLKDIAESLNLSIGTVQRALNNKGGYSAETQARILQEAERLNYKVNAAASSLRRSPINIAVVLPEPVGTNKYFFQYIWAGIENARRELSVFNIRISKHYCELKSEQAVEEFNRLLNGTYGHIDGVITNAMSDPKMLRILKKFSDKGIPTFRVNAPTQVHKFDNGLSTSSNMYVGQLYADIFQLALGTKEGQLLLLGGYRESERQSERINSFHQSMVKICPNILISEIHSFNDVSKMKQSIEEYTNSFSNLLGICAVSARETLWMCEIIKDLGLAGEILTVGTDVFPELLPYFEDGTLAASVYQYPTQQGYSAVKALVSDKTKINLSDDSLQFPATVVFKSNARAYTEINSATSSQ